MDQWDQVHRHAFVSASCERIANSGRIGLSWRVHGHEKFAHLPLLVQDHAHHLRDQRSYVQGQGNLESHQNIA